jgi:uncharacterized Zn finger protein
VTFDIDAMAGQALITAPLLAGEMPQANKPVFEPAPVTLFPDKSLVLITDCSGPDDANPGKHGAGRS